MSDDRQEPPAGDDDRTRPLPPPGTGREPVDRTQRLPGPDERAPGADDATRQVPTDRTAPMDRTAAMPPERSGGPAAWSGRAEVPPPRPADPREAEWYAGEQGSRRWWLPILWGVIVLLLLGLLGVGLWLALQSTDDDDPGGPQPSASATRPSPTTAAPTTASPTSAPTSSSPSASPTTPAAQLPMPPVVNLPLETAQAILDDLGLGHRVEYQESDRPAGTVLSTDPEAGELIPDGEEVTLVVARGAASPTGGVTPSVEPTATR
ncbi:PASTA domain-containing protein [Micromonospora sp. CPCC 205561]|uniref:PASTA domain-containing protein n=1 Tax=Micromonospora sp. CPCC 205561 TaxID=3122407 RepID=UPI002FF0A700